MPTGITAIIGEKENVTLEEFAMRCARHFGALIDMRDEPMDAPIPEKLEMSSYYKNSFDKARKDYDEFMALSDDEKVAYLEKKHNETVEHTKNYAYEVNERRKVLRIRYENMLQKILKWQAPTPDHEELRNFMIKQIEESIDYDCRVYEPHLSEKAFSVKEYEDILRKNVEYFRKKYNKEKATYKEKNKWLTDLRESLKNCE